MDCVLGQFIVPSRQVIPARKREPFRACEQGNEGSVDSTNVPSGRELVCACTVTGGCRVITHSATTPTARIAISLFIADLLSAVVDVEATFVRLVDERGARKDVSVTKTEQTGRSRLLENRWPPGEIVLT
jgi:hypothetical protein